MKIFKFTLKSLIPYLEIASKIIAIPILILLILIDINLLRSSVEISFGLILLNVFIFSLARALWCFKKGLIVFLKTIIKTSFFTALICFSFAVLLFILGINDLEHFPFRYLFFGIIFIYFSLFSWLISSWIFSTKKY